MTPRRSGGPWPRPGSTSRSGRNETSIGPTTRVVLVVLGQGRRRQVVGHREPGRGAGRPGLTVGVLDADIWGFSVPRMLGVEGGSAGRADGDRKLMVPLERKIGEGLLRVVSMGFLVGTSRTRSCGAGLMLNRAVQHFLQDVDWGDDLDYLLIDMPPGTGDVQMGVAKLVPRAEVIVVTTPALAAQKVAARAVSMARKNYLRVAGVIENMSAFRATTASPTPSSARAAARRWPPMPGAPARSGPRSSRRWPPAATPASRWCSATGRRPRPSAAIAERIVTEAVPPSRWRLLGPHARGRRVARAGRAERTLRPSRRASRRHRQVSIVAEGLALARLPSAASLRRCAHRLSAIGTSSSMRSG